MKKTSNGATFAELLVVMAIIAIFSSIVLLNWRSGEKQYALQRSATKLSQDIRRAEEFSISTKDFMGQVPSGGYGVYFNVSEPSHYILFADINGDAIYNAGSDGIVEDITIEVSVQIYQLSSPSLTITFVPPDPMVKITPVASTAQVILSLKSDQTKIKTVTINKLGLVY